jgi:enterochelin esterase family protein
MKGSVMPLRILASLLILALTIHPTHAQDNYKMGPESMEQKGVPKGETTKYTWESKVFAGTKRDYYVYVPKQYDPKVPACVMVFQDGFNYQNPKGNWHATIVLDNLIHKKDLPVIIGIFIEPGTSAAKGGKKGGSNRSFEYDTLSPQYAQFLEKEMLPEVGKKYKLRSDAAGRAISGFSSGAICAFTVAWERPDLFSKVMSHFGSFTNIRGGNRYPDLIRAAPKKNIRVFLQDGSNDLKNQFGNWYEANKAMEAAFKFKEYDHKAVFGDGGHTANHGASILPDSMRWLWRDTPPAKVEAK